MRSFKALLLLMCLAVSTTVWAESINESQARTIAARFMASRALPSTSLKMASKAPRLSASAGADQAAYYVFNCSTRGYVIVAGDDRAPAVLGYSDEGTFDSENVPEGLQYLLEGYAAQIDALTRGAKAETQLRDAGAIRPLVTSSWGQDNPYNILLPYLPSGKHVYTGCVATALSQVMRYWKWPARPSRPIPAYTSTYTANNETMSFNMPELPVVDFDWNAMQDTYETFDTASVAALAAARLNLYSAQVMKMTFGKYSSNANTAAIPAMAAAYFDYDASAHVAGRSNYSTQGWTDLIYAELVAGRPVIYFGSKKTGGHAFICDGYDGNGMFHFNWGWNGDSNGYYLLNVINPDEQGTGSAAGAYGYIYSQGALVGFKPNKGGSHTFELTTPNVMLNSYTGTREDTNQSFKAVVSGNFYNYTSNTIDVRFGWGLFNVSGEMIKRLYSAYIESFEPGHFTLDQQYELLFGEGMTSGTYRILPIYSELGQDNWRPCVGADRNYIEVTIDGNQCSFTGHGTSGTRDYVVNNVYLTGYMHAGRSIAIDVNMTNNGLSSNEMLHMFINGAFAASGYVCLETGETGNIHYTYLFNTPGNYTLTWSWNEDGSNPIATSYITINPMPAANLSGTIRVLDVDETGKVINSDKISVELTITNNGETTYDEDISTILYKHTYGNYGTSVQDVSQRLVLAPGETTKMQFDMTNVIDGWSYFLMASYYSEGVQKTFDVTAAYTVVFPEIPQVIPGDVDGDGIVAVPDVTALIDYMLFGDSTGINLEAADLDGDHQAGMSDLTILIDIILGLVTPVNP